MVVGGWRSSTCWIFFCSNLVPFLVSECTKYNISGERNDDFVVLTSSPALLSCFIPLAKSWMCSSKLLLLMISRSSKYYRCTNPIRRMRLDIFYSKISGHTYTHIGNLRYWYFPHGVIMIHNFCRISAILGIG